MKIRICKICNKEINTYKFAFHIKHEHNIKNIVSYYVKIINNGKIGYCEICNKETKFRSIDYGFEKVCSKECRKILFSESRIGKSVNVGKKQSKETIEKRILHTDQKKKEEKRKQTCLERYGVDNASKTNEVANKISKTNTGRKCPRTEEHSYKIVESKRKNGTLKCTDETKQKISKSLQITLSDPNFDKTKFLSKNSTYVYGYFDNMYYRSSYELAFLEFCKKYNLKVESAENNKYAVNYIDSVGKSRKYFPDFYLSDYDVVVEVKPISMYELNLNKFDAAMRKYKYIIVTDEELFNDWELYECICCA